jgi:hypothetical protein
LIGKFLTIKVFTLILEDTTVSNPNEIVIGELDDPNYINRVMFMHDIDYFNINNGNNRIFIPIN